MVVVNYTNHFNQTVEDAIVSELLAEQISFPYLVRVGPHKGKPKYESGDFVGCFKDLVRLEQESIKIKVKGEWYNYHRQSGRKLKFSSEFVNDMMPELAKSNYYGKEEFPEAREEANFITVSEAEVISTVRGIVGYLNLRKSFDEDKIVAPAINVDEGLLDIKQNLELSRSRIFVTGATQQTFQ